MDCEMTRKDIGTAIEMTQRAGILKMALGGRVIMATIPRKCILYLLIAQVGGL